MSQTTSTRATREAVEAFYQRLKSGEPERIAELFADRVDWYIPGNEALAPWLGRRSSRREVAEMFRQLFANIEPLRAEVQQTLVDGEIAVSTGELASRMRVTGKVFESIFSTQFTVRNGEIVRYRLLEEGWGLVVALTPEGV